MLVNIIQRQAKHIEIYYKYIRVSKTETTLTNKIELNVPINNVINNFRFKQL